MVSVVDGADGAVMVVGAAVVGTAVVGAAVVGAGSAIVVDAEPF